MLRADHLAIHGMPHGFAPDTAPAREAAALLESCYFSGGVSTTVSQ